MFIDDVDYPEIFMVSDEGEVFLKRTGKVAIIKPNKKGYCLIGTKIGGRQGKCVTLKVHRMVAKAFIPNPLNLPEVNHIDGNKTNNRLNNLEWCSRKENMKHAAKAGLLNPPSGEDHRCYTLTPDDIEYIIKNYKPYDKYFGLRPLGRRFKVCHSSIHQVINRKK